MLFNHLCLLRPPLKLKISNLLQKYEMIADIQKDIDDRLKGAEARALGGKFGDFILANKDTFNKARFDVAKILINSSNPDRISEKMMISSRDENFEISVIEDGIQ
ncbi:hypothetical protein ACFE04_017869 [Oxalis oulophora]